MKLSTIVRAAQAARAQERPLLASRLLAGAANRTSDQRQAFALAEASYELAIAA